jgi:PAS domain-containing protein
MAESSTALKTVIDLAIIGAFAYAFWVFQKHKKSVLVKELRADFFLMILGIGIISLFYLCNLVCKRLTPFFAVDSLPAYITQLHHEFMWIILPVGVGLVVAGFARSILRSSSIISALKASEGHVHEIGQEAVTALSKLNQSEAELTDQNERFHAALENMSQGLCMFDREQRLIVCNGLYASMYGLSNELVKPGTTFRQILEHRIRHNIFVGDDSNKYIEERLSAVSEDKASTKIQLLSDGRVFAIAHRPLADGGWVATHEDISELAKAEAMNQRLASIVEDAINEIYVFDAHQPQIHSGQCQRL